MLKNKTILLGITGGISAYKICSLIRMYKKAGANVRTVVTPNALNFVTKLTLETLSGNKVYAEMFEMEDYKPEHISLTEADIFVIAPASANTISKLACGICDNLLLSTACAYNGKKLLVPAMNTNMWNNKFIQENLEKLIRNGYSVLEPDSGFLACGTEGEGRMKEPEEIFNKTEEILTPKTNGKKLLITAGGTREMLDPARCITNLSSGRMGLALADEAFKKGFEVTLISTFKAEKPYKNIVVQSALEMEQAVKENLEGQNGVIMAAAVGDYRALNYSEQKIKKGSEDKITIELVKNPDILKEIVNLKKCVKVSSGNSSLEEKEEFAAVGFCAESENLLENAKTKLQNKGCDYIIANDISRKDIGFESAENEIYIIDKQLNVKHYDKDTKQNIARYILEEIFE